MNINIPIYRAKKIDSDEYVIGWYSSPIIIEGKLYLSITNQDGEHRIDTTTLSIHFPDMIDSQGNAIFASLQENGKGGDICESKWFNIDDGLTVKTESVRYSNNTMLQDGYNISRYEYKKIIGVQE